MIIFRAVYTSPDKIFFLMLTPCITAYTFVPFVHALWEKMYYKSYEVGNNFLYIPSLQEVTIKEEDMDSNMDNDEDVAMDI